MKNKELELKLTCQCKTRKEHKEKHKGKCVHVPDNNTRHLPSAKAQAPLPVGKYWYYHCAWCDMCLPEYSFSYSYQ